jgi:hypothetical protein
MGDTAKPVDRTDLVTLAEATRKLSEEFLGEQNWSGVPMPIMGHSLVLEPRYKLKIMEEFRWKEYFDENGVRYEIPAEPTPKPSGFKRVNSWWSARLQGRVSIYHDIQGNARAGYEPENRLHFTLRTMEASAAWPIEAEKKALQKLTALLPEHDFELYQLTGQFFEISKRSQVTYLFRKGRPPVAMRMNETDCYWLCALCLHPIGYYADTWAGVMCPTDEVIAHVLMMRGSEEKYWANANQHPIDHPAAGI